MHVKFTHGFILGWNLEILLLSYPGRDRSVTAAEFSNTYQFITLYYAWTRQWPDPIVILLGMHDLSPLLYKAQRNPVKALTR